ncbi:MAG: hypothetical protein SFU20_05775 [Chitinophagaceae bacterium]|nr:hypothetical protein [Chitinophagaceae bacterium]
MDSLGKVWKVKVERNIDGMLLEPFYKEGARGIYALDVYFQCNKLLLLNMNADSAYELANQTVLPLFDIIKNESKYDEIAISFTCSTSLAQSSKFKDMVFRFSIDSLDSNRSSISN